MSNIKGTICKLISTLALVLFVLTGAISQETKLSFKDTLDGAFDISSYLYDLHGFLPVPSLITEPAVGYGGLLAGAVFLPKKDTLPGQRFRMPDIAMIAGAYTQNKTWMAGGGYLGFWNQDRIRYRGFMGYANANLEYFFPGEDPRSINFTLKSYFLLQQVTFRIADSRFLVGGKYQLGLTTVEVGSGDATIPSEDIDMTNSGLGLVVQYDGFDNLLCPTRGINVNVAYDQFLELIGSDRNSGKLGLSALYFANFNDKWISGFRLDGRLATGDPPFYQLPFIDLRGVPVMRYQGDQVILLETEQMYMIKPRWGVLAFGGFGSTFAEFRGENVSETAWNVGAGFRYTIARLLGLKMGVDIARGPEDWAFYIVAGYAWSR